MVVVFVGGVVVGGHAEATGLTQLRDPLRGFLLGDSGESLPSQVLDVLRDDYYKPIDEKKLESLSVDRDDRGAQRSLHGLPQRGRARGASPSTTPAVYSGVGLALGAQGSSLVVRSVTPGGPADQAGIRAGDRLVSIDGQRITAADLPGIVNRVRGPEGTQVTPGRA